MITQTSPSGIRCTKIQPLYCSHHQGLSSPALRLFLDDDNDVEAASSTSSGCDSLDDFSPRRTTQHVSHDRENLRAQPQHNEKDLNLLVLDHYDSFTYNLVDQLAQICGGKRPSVLAADAATTWEELLHQLQDAPEKDSAATAGKPRPSLDGIVLSPGPGHPSDSICQLAHDVIQNNPQLPILGVCLGHQIMGQVYGADCVPAPTPVHGQVQRVEPLDVECPLLWGSGETLPHTFNVTRYHSLQVTWNASDSRRIPLVATAHSADVVVMGLRHTTRPHFGVQFHPESIGSQPYGAELLRRFCHLCVHHKQKRLSQQLQPRTALREEQTATPLPSPTRIKRGASATKTRSNGSAQPLSQQPQPHQVLIHKLGKMELRPMDVMQVFLNDNDKVEEHSNNEKRYRFWLDSSDDDSNRAQTTSGTRTRNKMSFLGYCGQRRVEYWGPEKAPEQKGLYIWENGRCKHSPDSDIMEYLKDQHSQARTTQVELVDFSSATNGQQGHATQASGDHTSSNSNKSFTVDSQLLSEQEAMDVLPFAFRGGHVGYLGYEVRHVTQQSLTEQEHGRLQHEDNSPRHFPSDEAVGGSAQSSPQIPTAAFGLADRTFVFDHDAQEWYLVGVLDDKDEDDSDGVHQSRGVVLEWMRETATAMRAWTRTRTEREGAHTSRKEHRITNGHTVNGHQTVSASLNGQRTASFDRIDKMNNAKTRGPIFTPNRSREIYSRNFAKCLEYIRNGESYELCLTNQLQANVKAGGRSLLDLYRTLRSRNPAPFSAFFDWNSSSAPSSTLRKDDDGHNDSNETARESESSVCICCSSPERFISVMPQENTAEFKHAEEAGDSGEKFQVEAKPIKGTIARVLSSDNNNLSAADAARLDAERIQTLQHSVKDRAENLMIVDLLRNDLSRVCQVGSVHVSKLMAIETYATVHQMVSTIRGIFTLRGDEEEDKDSRDDKEQRLRSIVDILTASFPGGSMTGAPKFRTMQLLDELEESVSRGPYSGALGYISWNGAIDMNKVIRTAVVTPQHHGNHTGDEGTAGESSCGTVVRSWNVDIGAGGAITTLSDNDDEYDEMKLKASAVMDAVRVWSLSPPVLSHLSQPRSSPHRTSAEGAEGGVGDFASATTATGQNRRRVSLVPE